ncbi:hypothetical protein G6F46_013564 [Rhizopus delemar]|nr:hypothetical protein G6F63_016004 [Rhizopus arrhizus]KAG1368863.1 hypothetical protein G6F59_018769 [Rhizopus arrhizus]KAG1605680.1 hypothetical protein G6F46_013564 [Rhizopus delemar]
MRADRLRPDRRAGPRPGAAARAERRCADGGQPPAQEPEEVQELARPRGHHLLPRLRCRPAGVRGRHRRLRGRRWPAPHLPACAGIRRAGGDSGERRAPSPQRVAGGRA